MKLFLGIVLVVLGILLLGWGHLLVEIAQAISTTKDRYAGNKLATWTVRVGGVILMGIGLTLSL